MKYGQSGDWIRAEAAFFKAVQGHPADPLYLLNLARSQMKNEERDKALLNANLVTVDFGRQLWAMAACWSKGLAPEHLDI